MEHFISIKHFIYNNSAQELKHRRPVIGWIKYIIQPVPIETPTCYSSTLCIYKKIRENQN
jgi:hypothetical protein